MIASLPLRCLLTVVFVGACLPFLVAHRADRVHGGRSGEVHGGRSRVDRVTDAAHVVVGAAMVAMLWPAVVPGWAQLVVFGAAGLWFLGTLRPRRPAAGLHHALMAASMVWMLAGCGPTGVAMAGMASAATATVGVVLAAYFLLAAALWSADAMRRVGRIGAAGHAVMSIGTGAVLLSAL